MVNQKKEKEHHDSQNFLGVEASRISPFIKWPGGKSSELNVISKYSPKKIDRFFDPFLGGGSVLLSMSSNNSRFGNDLCFELIELFKALTQNQERTIAPLLALLRTWEDLKVPEHLLEDIIERFIRQENQLSHFWIDLKSDHDEINFLIQDAIKRFPAELQSKLQRTLKLQVTKKKLLPREDLARTIQGVLKASFYYAVRSRYNEQRALRDFSIWRTCNFFLTRELAYAAMFRFNSRGDFNVPYGGITYNEKNLLGKVTDFLAEGKKARLDTCEFFNEDYRDFLNRFEYSNNDFIFIDPPYDSVFSSYDNKSFDQSDQKTLENYLSKSNAKIMVLIGDTPMIRQIYSARRWNLIETEKLYMWNIKSRNDGRAKHLLIRNYSD